MHTQLCLYKWGLSNDAWYCGRKVLSVYVLTGEFWVPKQPVSKGTVGDKFNVFWPSLIGLFKIIWKRSQNEM